MDQRIPLMLSLSLCSATLTAADAEGRFAIKGIGNTDCTTFVSEMEQSTPNAYMYGGWIYGFLTADNKASEETFDLVAWEDLETLTSYLHGYCKRNPEAKFAQAVFQLGEALRADRITSATSPIQIGTDEASVFVYQTMIGRIQDRLRELGHLQQDQPDGSSTWDEATEAALKAFQASEELTVSGLPTQLTLHHLFR